MIFKMLAEIEKLRIFFSENLENFIKIKIFSLPEFRIKN